MKAKTFNVDVDEIVEGVYLCSIKNRYDLAMTFCRVQEFYESPFKEIRGKKFHMMYFMELYSKRRGDGAFTYASDWVGFNVPGNIVQKMFELGIDDVTEYDEIIKKIHERAGSSRYYLIGSSGKDKKTINHELCHALYYLHEDYKHAADKITKKISSGAYKKLCKFLLELGYTKQVLADEIQAYLSTDCIMFDEIKFTKKESLNVLEAETELKMFFKQYKKKNKIKI
jgi:hypothetical protein